MSKALCCDHCDTMLPLNSKGEHEGGEDSAWIVLHIANDGFDLCSRACTIEFLQRPEIVEAHDAWLECITGIVRSIAEGREAESDE